MGEVERAAGIKSRGYISRTEAGKLGKRPSEEMVNRLATVLGVSREWLASGDAVPPAIGPFVTGQVTPKRTVEREEPYASRARFLFYAQREGLNGATLELMASDMLEGGDPGDEYWERRYSELEARRKKIAALKEPAAPTAPDASTAEVLAKRRRR